jgi:uncharacterized protein (PEP-CTERM system associated)
MPGLALAQISRTEFSLASQVTASDNGELAPVGQERGDTILRVTPRMRMTRQGAGLRLNVDAGAGLIATSSQSQNRDRVIPDAQGTALATVVERVFFVDSAFDIRQVEENPFGGRFTVGAAQNSRTAATARISPFVDLTFTPTLTGRARVDGIWTRFKDTQVGDSNTQRALARVESKPVPLGWVVELGSEKTSYRNPDSSEIRIDQAVATGTATLGYDWVVGVAVGRERALLNGTIDSDSLVGARLYWIPGPRTDFAMSFDRRFFGDGVNVSARHRTPQTAWVLRVLREPATAGSGIRGDGLATFLDAILTTRNPDPAARAAAVDQLIATRGLSSLPPGAISAVGSYPQLRTAADLTWVYLAPRTTVTLGAFGEQRVRLVREGEPAVATADGDARQAGASLTVNRRLSPQSGIELGAAYSRIKGLAIREGELTREASLRAAYLASLSPQLSATLGAQVRRMRTNANQANSFDENSVFAGLAYRF